MKGLNRWRKPRRRTEDDIDLDALASAVERDFLAQFTGMSTGELTRAAARGEKAVEALIDEFHWDAMDSKRKENLEQFIEQLRSRQNTDPDFLMFSAYVSQRGLDADDRQELAARVRQKLILSGLQSLAFGTRDDSGVWFMGTFVR